MKKEVVVVLCILALVGMAAWKVSEGWRENRQRTSQQVMTSDAKDIDHYLTIGGDDWLGYLIYRSPRFQRQMLEQGVSVQFEMEPDFRERFAKLQSGAFGMVCATIDSYLLNGQPSGYPGVIVMAVDESYGGDAIVAKPPITSLDDLKGEGMAGAFVGFSPSEFLLKSQVAHFGLGDLLPQMGKFRTDDADAALDKFRTDPATQFAVLWEPLVSRALKEVPGSQRLIDTSKARGIIVDVAIASRELVADQPEVVQKVADVYFDTLEYYNKNRSELLQLAIADSGASSADAEAMLRGIKFYSAWDNLGLVGTQPGAKMTDHIRNITSIMLDVGDIQSDPLRGNPSLLVNSQFILQTPQAKQSGAGSSSTSSSTFFRPLDESGWQRLAQNLTGTLVDQPITFGVGQAQIPDEFQADLKAAAAKLSHYPSHRVIVQAHVSPGSDAEVDLQLSRDRAQAIRDFLVSQCQVPSHRVYAMGMGGEEPVARESGESLRAWKRRCRRAKIFIAEEG